MGSYSIGISGLRVAKTALDIIGNNISNSSTEGYHCQDIRVSPADESYSSGFMIGQGVSFDRIVRKIDEILEKQILHQSTAMSSLSTQSESLQTIQSTMGEILSDGISTALESFYTAFEDLSVKPEDASLQIAVVSAAQTLCNQLQNAASVIMELQESAYNKAQTTVDTINEKAEQVASLNKTISDLSIKGYDCANLKDQRDQLIAELNELADLTTRTDDSERVNISIGGIPLVVGSNSFTIEAQLLSDGTSYTLAICSTGSENYSSNVEGGTLGGVMTLYNDTLDDILEKVNTLAQTIISQTNDLHVQGIGSDGSFSTLNSNTMPAGSVSEYDLPVEEGEFFIRVTAPDGTVARYQINVNENSTTQSICDGIAQIPGLTNTAVNSGRLQIIADAGYTFDFLSGVLSAPSAYASLDDSLLLGGGTEATAPPSIDMSGAYTGTASDDFTCTVTTAGGLQELGTGTMTLTVTDGLGTVIDTIDIGSGYESGDSIMLSNGLMISLNGSDASPGYFNDGDVFTLSALVLEGGGTEATAEPAIQVSGIYTGNVNQVYTCTVSASSDPQAIGTGTMTLTVQDGSGATVASINIGSGYVSGTAITLENGLSLTLDNNGISAGYFNDGDIFTFQALADSDTSGFLSAVGLNCFFNGVDASTITLSDDIVNSEGRIATSLSADGMDNSNAKKIAQLGETSSSALGGLSTTDYYINLATDVGSQLSSVQLQYNNAESVYNSLIEQRDKISGVDINEQAIKMMAYEQLYQAMSKYLVTVSDSIQLLMSIVS